MRYDATKDPKVADARALLASIDAEEHLPAEVQIQRLTVIRREVQARVTALKRKLEGGLNAE